MSNTDLLIEAAEKVEANIECPKCTWTRMSLVRKLSACCWCRQHAGQNVSAHQKGRYNNQHTTYQQRQPSYNAGRGNPGRGAFGYVGGVNAVQALPPQEKEFQPAQTAGAYEPHVNAIQSQPKPQLPAKEVLCLRRLGSHSAVLSWPTCRLPTAPGAGQRLWPRRPWSRRQRQRDKRSVSLAWHECT